MTQHNPQTAQTVSLGDIRGIYPHLPAPMSLNTAMERPAFLVFVHDMEAQGAAAGQDFLARNNNFDTRATQPLAVAAEMCLADYKIFDLSPPESQSLPTREDDVALAVSYGMVTVEQGVDAIALHAVGQNHDERLAQIATLSDLMTTGALHIAACYGATIAARMAGIPVTLTPALANCLSRIAESEGWSAVFDVTDATSLKEMALALIAKKAALLMG